MSAALTNQRSRSGGAVVIESLRSGAIYVTLVHAGWRDAAIALILGW